MSSGDNVNGIEEAGSIRLIDGQTSVVLSPIFYGSVESDAINNKATVLSNDNFVFITPLYDNASLENTDAVHLLNKLGKQVGNSLYGKRHNQPLIPHLNNQLFTQNPAIHSLILCDPNLGFFQRVISSFYSKNNME